MSSRPRSTGAAWAIHASVIVTLAALYTLTFWEAWFPPPDQPFNLDGIAAGIGLVLVIGYAAMTTVVMPLVSRRLYGPAVMHGLLLAIYFTAMALDDSDAASRRDLAASR